MQDNDITPYNNNGQADGYWKQYYSNGQLAFKGNFVDGKRHGYWEAYYEDGTLAFKGYFKNAKQIGLWIQDDKEYFYAQ